MCNRLPAAARITSAALTRAGYHPGRFNRLMIFTEQCNAAVSAAQQPGRLSWIRYRNPGAATLIHELGHNLGLGHAYGVVCRADGRRVAFGGTCHSVEYGDSWDAMGHSRASFSVPVLAAARLGRSGRHRHRPTARSGSPTSSTPATTSRPSGSRWAGRRTGWSTSRSTCTQVGRSIAGVTIRRQVGDGRVQIVDAAPGNPTGAALPRRRPDQRRAAGRQQLHHAGGRPDHHGRHRAPGDRPGRLRPGRDRPGRPGRRLRRPAGRGPVPRPLAAARRQRPDRARLPRDRARLGPLGLPALHGRRTDLARAGRRRVVVPARSPSRRSTRSAGRPRRAWPGQAYGPQVTVTSPERDAHVRTGFDVTLTAAPDDVTGSEPVQGVGGDRRCRPARRCRAAAPTRSGAPTAARGRDRRGARGQRQRRRHRRLGAGPADGPVPEPRRGSEAGRAAGTQPQGGDVVRRGVGRLRRGRR